MLNCTHSFAELELSPAAYDEIAGKLREAGYDHVFCEEGQIDMHGLGITRQPEQPADWRCVHCKLVIIGRRSEPSQCPECGCHTFAKIDA